jgi:hypothetical protein
MLVSPVTFGDLNAMMMGAQSGQILEEHTSTVTDFP